MFRQVSKQATSLLTSITEQAECGQGWIGMAWAAGSVRPPGTCWGYCVGLILGGPRSRLRGDSQLKGVKATAARAARQESEQTLLEKTQHPWEGPQPLAPKGVFGAKLLPSKVAFLAEAVVVPGVGKFVCGKDGQISVRNGLYSESSRVSPRSMPGCISQAGVQLCPMAALREGAF